MRTRPSLIAATALLALALVARVERPAFAQCEEESSEPIAAVGEAVSSAAARTAPAHADGFADAFLAAFADGAHASESDLAAMRTALSHERGARRDQAEALFGLVKNDGELSACETDAARAALGSLLGTPEHPANALPADAERVFAHPAPAANVTVKHYALDLDLSNSHAASFPARATLTLDRPAPTATKTILEADPDRLSITGVRGDGRDVPFAMKDGRLEVDAPGAKVLDIRYDVKPTTTKGGHGLVRDPATGRMWTMLWPYYGGSLLPSNSAPSDGSTATLSVRAPAGYEAIASGQRAGDGGSFSSAAETPVYANAIYLAPDFEHGDAGVSATGVHVAGVGLGRAASAATREAYRAVARDAIDFYSGWLGPYAYGDTLRTVELASGGMGGMEHVSAVAIMIDSARDPEYSKQTAAHEVAHHWFGDNLRIAGWNDFWMSEGFTEYSEHRYFRHAQGEEKFRSLFRDSKRAVRDQLASGAHALHPGPCTDVNDIFDDVPYEEGAWMLRMLEARMGTPRFDAMLKAWYGAHRFRPVSTDEFVAFASRRAGENLQPWFDAWSTIQAVPSLAARVDVHGKKVSASLTPRNAMPAGITIPLRIEGAGGASKTVMVAPGAPVKIDAGFEVTGTSWDPDVTVLADVHPARGDS